MTSDHCGEYGTTQFLVTNNFLLSSVIHRFPLSDCSSFTLSRIQVFFTFSSRDNVCVVKHESTDEWAGNEVGIADQPDFSINIQSCIEEHGKYICRTM